MQLPPPAFYVTFRSDLFVSSSAIAGISGESCSHEFTVYSGYGLSAHVMSKDSCAAAESGDSRGFANGRC